MDDPVEEWRMYGGAIFEVSNLGNVRNPQTKHNYIPFKHYKDCSRKHIFYLMVKRWDLKRKIHHLVAECFLPPRPAGWYVIDHINGNREDNRAINLQWLDFTENSRKGNRPDYALMALREQG